MSGIAGLLQLDGAPVDARQMRRMTEVLAFRGPDAQGVWTDGSVGFGHALLRTTRESRCERQPCTLDGQVWITADARLDARSELISRLRSKDQDCSRDIMDAELILRAYGVWGEDCVLHLLGDFSFAIWDGGKRKLFCARDHFGIKPFFYAQGIGFLVFSNTLECVRAHPAVSDELNTRALSDFLLFDFTDDLSATIFAAIRRLAPAHVLTCADRAVTLRRYWELPIEGPTHHKHAGDCVEQFREVFDAAVADRLRSDRVGILLSGGLDSSTVAASAARLLPGQPAPCDLHAYSTVYDSLIPHDEREYAGTVSAALGIPIEYQVADGYRLFERADQPELCRPEPIHDPLGAVEMDQLREVSRSRRVALTGYGGDPALASFLFSHFWKRLKSFRFGALAADLARYLSAEGRLRRLYLRQRLGRWFNGGRVEDCYPVWLNEDFARRLDLPARWRESIRTSPVDHPVRPEAYQLLTEPFWCSLFEGYDPGVTKVPIEVRHPFFDLRVLRYLLTLPAVPWCSDKELLRVSLRRVLPDAVRLRRKAPLAGNPITALLARPREHWVDSFEPAPELAHYVVRSRIPSVACEKDTWRAWTNLRPLSLNFWLQLAAHKDPKHVALSHSTEKREHFSELAGTDTET